MKTLSKFTCSFIVVVVLLSITSPVRSQDVAALNNQNISLTYEEAIAQYQKLSKKYGIATLFEIGTTDVGRPLHLFVISKKKKFTSTSVDKKTDLVYFINNGIHPGEPDGIDASVRFSEKLLNDQALLPENVIICIVPVFNIGGALNRGCCSRANQNGPEQYGFRGNARNLDLNRDFIKCDSKNTLSLVQALTSWDPDIFVDTHVSNGADYPYVMTLLATQPDKLGGVLNDYMRSDMLPDLYAKMQHSGFEMIPYVNTQQYNDDPRKGIYDYLETPRYASGFCALFGTLALVSETHMLKPFQMRVDATEELLKHVLTFADTNRETIISKRTAWKKEVFTSDSLALKFVCDTTAITYLPFKGYESYTAISKVTGLPQLYYDSSRPYSDSIQYYNVCRPENWIRVPQKYIVPQAWSQVIERLKASGVEMTRMEKDSRIKVSSKFMVSYETKTSPYEGHYLHYNTSARTQEEERDFYKGDYIIEVNQDAFRYIIESLEPEGDDSFFAWGFFDSILQQKEWFSSYVFDGYAQQLLEIDAELKADFEERKKSDAAFARDSFSQLYFIYSRSPLFENSLNRYPVGMIYK